MKIQEFCDMKVFDEILEGWAVTSGLAAKAVGSDGKTISNTSEAYAIPGSEESKVPVKLTDGTEVATIHVRQITGEQIEKQVSAAVLLLEHLLNLFVRSQYN